MPRRQRTVSQQSTNSLDLSQQPVKSKRVKKEDYAQLEQLICQLSEVIKTQSNEINTLKSQLQFIFSYIGIDGSSLIDDTTTSNTTPFAQVSQVSNTTSILMMPNSGIGSNESEMNANDEVNGNNPSSTATEIKIQPTKKSPVMNGNSNLCQSVVAAMYVEQKQKSRRSNSFIVSGLPVENDIDDVTKIKHYAEMI